MFKELDDNLTSIEGEVTKLKTAVEHIETAKSAAETAVNTAETTNKEFKEHLQKVMVSVDSILEPHKELITSTEKLAKKMEAVDFPKQLKIIKLIALSTFAIALIGTVLILILK